MRLLRCLQARSIYYRALIEGSCVDAYSYSKKIVERESRLPQSQAAQLLLTVFPTESYVVTLHRDSALGIEKAIGIGMFTQKLKPRG